MKELSIKEKAELYDKALERAKNTIEVNQTIPDIVDCVKSLFPELIESEDEEIRKSITEFFKNYSERGTWKVIPDVTKWIDWLERHGEQDNNEDVDILHRFSFYSYKDEPNVLYLSGLYVNEEYRNNGIGTKILKVADEVTKSLDCRVIRLKTKKDSNAERLYRTHGYNSLEIENKDEIWLEKQSEQKSLDEIAKESTKNKEAATSFLKSCGIMNANGELADEYKIEQDEQKPTKVEPKFKIGDVIEVKPMKCHDKIFTSKPNKIIDITEKCYILDNGKAYSIEELQDGWKLSEQKPTKVEPKFKAGDWVVYNNDICQIVKREEGCNKLITVFGIEKELVNERNLSTARFWTIQDAKDGDVLYQDLMCGKTFIYNGVNPDMAILYSFIISNDGEDVLPYHIGKPNIGIGNIEENKNIIHPATIEQRDALMKAMTDAGYTFDFEKKELKKIVAPIFNVGDTIAKKHNSDIHDFDSFTITDITGEKYWYNDRIICDISEQDEWEFYEPVRQKPTEWSEEDEKKRKCLIKGLEDRMGFGWASDPFSREEYIDWLKSLKERIQPRLKYTEWTEKDEINRDLIYNALNHVYDLEHNKSLCDWLNSLIPQLHWKPSEGQISALEWQVKNTYKGSWQYIETKKLLEQLKKL